MTYAGNRRINDADSHLMELPDFLTSRADADYAEAIAGLNAGSREALPGVDVGPFLVGARRAGRHGS